MKNLRGWSGCALVLACASPGFGATVDLTVRERDGPPVHDQRVVVHPPLAHGESYWMQPRDRTRHGTTGVDGRITFDGLPPGSYTVSLQDSADPSLLAPSDNPYAPAPVFTLAREDQRLAVLLELWRGVPVTAQITVDHGDVPPARIVFRSIDGPQEIRLALDPTGRGLLVPGRWEAAFEFPAGYLLADLVWNGESLPGCTVRLDVTEDLRSHSLTAHLTARARVTGRISSNIPDECPASIVATLGEPAGDWLPEALARGGSEFQRVGHQFKRDCVYELWLPEGRWSVRPEGAAIVRSEPEQVEIAIGLGETKQVDFRLELKDPSGGSHLAVKVVEPGGRPSVGSVVEVQGSGGTVRSGRTRTPHAEAMFEGLAAGSYRVVAGDPDYLEATKEVQHDPEAREPTRVELELRQGARVHARATDEGEKAIAEVEVEVVRLGDPPEMQLGDEQIRALKLARAALTDSTGHAEIAGFHDGRYRVQGRMTGEQAGTRFVRILAKSDERVASLDVDLWEGQRLDLELAVLPAASTAGNLVCSDGGTLPPLAAFRVFEAAGARPDPWRDTDLENGPALAADALRLGGRYLDRFRVGPLPPGTFLLAVRPAGHEYWSWPPDQVVPERSAVVHLRETATVDLGPVEITCAPLVMLVPSIASGETTPDLREGALAAAAWSTGDDGRRIPATVETEVHEDRWFIRRLPEGKLGIGIRVTHPYLIPSELRLPDAEHDLVRGKLVKLELPFRAVGGLVEVRSATAVAARMIPAAGGSPTLSLAVAGKVSFPGSPPGTYRVELCADADCRRVERAWDGVVVSTRRTVRPS